MSSLSVPGSSVFEPIHLWFERVARSRRDRVALRTSRGETTYGELLERAFAIEAALPAAASRIAIMARDHAAIVAAIVGALRGGHVYAALAPDAPEATLVRQVGRVRPDAIVVDELAHARVASGVPAVCTTAVSAIAPRTPVEPRPARDAEPDAACSIYFTSGSTGAPRAIRARLSGIDHHVRWELAHLGLDERVRGTVLHAASYDAYLPDVFVPLCAGGIACAPVRGVERDPEALVRWLAEERITLVHCVPSILRALLEVPAARALPALRHVLLAGEAVRVADLARAREVLGPEVRLVNLYGPSEATLVKTHHELGAADLVRATIPIGRPMPGVTVHVLDEQGEPVGTGEEGELAIQSRYGALGYVDEPEVTAARFAMARDGSGEIVYRTGDRGRLAADDLLEFCGRRDRQVKVLGARVDLDEVEAIVASCDGVVEAAVVVDAAHTACFAFVVTSGAPASAIRAAASERLLPAMRVARITACESLPRTSTGKIDRGALTRSLEIA